MDRPYLELLAASQQFQIWLYGRKTVLWKTIRRGFMTCEEASRISSGVLYTLNRWYFGLLHPT
jgi:hypothetical protein